MSATDPKGGESACEYPRDVCERCEERPTRALGLCKRCYYASKRAVAVARRSPLVAPDGFAVGFTISGGACHAMPSGSWGTSLCGRRLDQAWGRPVDRDHLRVTCGQCKKALRGVTIEGLLSLTELSASGCRLWLGSKLPKGYGVTQRPGQRIYAHRLAWELANGSEVPEGMVVMHECDTPACIEPAHLKLGTIADNNADMVSKGRAAWQKVAA